MGVIKDIIKKADQTPEITAEVKEALRLLEELSHQKADIFEEKIAQELRTAGTTENPTVPITVKLGSHQVIRVVTASTPDTDITKGVSEALKVVLTGSRDGIIDGLATLINTGLRAVLGVSEGDEGEEHAYYIATEGLAIVRLDLIYWSRHITASSITKYAEKSIVCTAVKSSVNLKKIDFNAFLASYQAQLLKCKFSENRLEEEIANAKRIYKLLTDDSDARADIDIQPFGIADFGVLSSTRNKADGVWPAITR